MLETVHAQAVANGERVAFSVVVLCLGCCLPVDAWLLSLKLILLNFDSQYEAGWGLERDTDTEADIELVTVEFRVLKESAGRHIQVGRRT